MQREKAERAVATYGLPVDIEPERALLDELHRTVGHVVWLGQLVAALEHGGVGYSVNDDGDYVPRSGLKQLDRTGKFEKASVWVELYQSERKHLANVAKDAIDAGANERVVRAVEEVVTQAAPRLAEVVQRVAAALLDAVLSLAAERAGDDAGRLVGEVRERWPVWVQEIAPRELRTVTGGSDAG